MADGSPILIVGGFGSGFQAYQGLRRLLAAASGRPVAVAPIAVLDWAAVVATDSYGPLLGVLDRAVRDALAAHQATRLTLVAHSAGGVLARIYLGDQPYGPRRLVYNGFERVAALVTLGTPHRVQGGGRLGGRNQIAFAQERYPGAYWRFVRYVSVAGRAIQGNAVGTPTERGAYQAYRLLGGSGDEWGDGVVVTAAALLDGSRKVVLPGIRHDPRPGLPWYGASAAIVQGWWEQVLAAEREPTSGYRAGEVLL